MTFTTEEQAAYLQRLALICQAGLDGAVTHEVFANLTTWTAMITAAFATNDDEQIRAVIAFVNDECDRVMREQDADLERMAREGRE